ncbi:MAG: serine hydroxymethyltransferase [Armatimonadota bacterium]|nr:serine hydroxymethyltransferase [Armatimonadota bacterium]MDR5675925.1 serine hydroxymethyltransferase [Armatimonadota bacterium]MDR5688983.1 serine hydroxymethyltransferase [Armatimonadota bacterium]MDR7386432.1 serine hydroxymethyltransferase [Armatimonadota bacterium]MDR7389269.1 serine hydroxymethyltransferase [Armatimonadota bacterium]
MLEFLLRQDPEVADAIVRDIERQQTRINLIASENYASRAVLEAQGSVLTNKYAEGYPGRRYYGGCEFVDAVERLAVDRAKALFGAEHANVQPHSGSQANFAAYFAVLQPGDKILAMNLAHGGHLTHGSPVNFSGQLFQVIPYGVDPRTEMLDYDQLARLAREHRPKMIVAGATAYPRHFDFPRLREIADEVGAYLLVDMAHFAGLVAGKVHPDPVPYAHLVTSTTHKTLRGPRSGMILCKEELAKAVDRAVFPFSQGGPLMHVIAAKAVCFQEASTPAFRAYAAQIVRNAQALAEELQRHGFHITSGGTDNHLMLVDLRSKGLTGKVAEDALGEAHIVVNKNMVPFDPQKPTVTSGMRLGTPAVTTRGMREDEMRQIGRWIARVLAAPDDETVKVRVRREVHELCANFPIYAEEDVPRPSPART